jgi:thymidylate synthase (FAD)
MKIIKPSFILECSVDGDEILRNIERAGRTCYKSEDRIDAESAKKFVVTLIRRGHETVLEHEKITIRIICDRGVSHEIVRHRIASYSQESTRYCNYSKDKFGGEINVIQPFFWSSSEKEELYNVWHDAMEAAEASYNKLISLGASPQEARSVLPNSLKTELVMTMNLREWRHFFRLRTAPEAHPQMLEIAKPMLTYFQSIIPVIFDDIL